MYLHPGKLSLRLIPPKNSQRTWHFLILKFNRLYPHPPNAIQNSRRPHFQINQDSSGPIQIHPFQNKHHSIILGWETESWGNIIIICFPNLFKIKSPPQKKNTQKIATEQLPFPPPSPYIPSPYAHLSPGFSPVTAIVFAVFWSSTTATWRATWAMALRKLRCPSDAAVPTVDPRREPEIAHVLNRRKNTHKLKKKTRKTHKKRYLFFCSMFFLSFDVRFFFLSVIFTFRWLLMMSISLSASWKSVSCEMKV